MKLFPPAELRAGRAITGLAIVLLLAPAAAHAVPSFARQTGLQCIVCHTQFPELTAFGHQFKLGGYTLASGDTELPPIAIMLQPSFTHTAKGQPGGAAPQFGPNDNVALNQASLFYAGRLFGPYAEKLFGHDGAAFANKFGIFSQLTYDGAAKTWAWDNTELRWANTGDIAGKPATYGFYLNNNPDHAGSVEQHPDLGLSVQSLRPRPSPGGDDADRTVRSRNRWPASVPTRCSRTPSTSIWAVTIQWAHGCRNRSASIRAVRRRLPDSHPTGGWRGRSRWGPMGAGKSAPPASRRRPFPAGMPVRATIGSSTSDSTRNTRPPSAPTI